MALVEPTPPHCVQCVSVVEPAGPVPEVAVVVTVDVRCAALEVAVAPPEQSESDWEKWSTCRALISFVSS